MASIRTAFYAKPLAAYLIAALMVLSSLAGPAEAMLVPPGSDAAGPAVSANRAADLTTVRATLESKVLRQRLEDYGLTGDEAMARINSLSDEQIHQLASNMQSVQPGGDGVGFVFSLVVIAALVVLIIFLLEGRIEIRKR